MSSRFYHRCAVGLSLACLLLTVLAVLLGQMNRRLQRDLQQRANQVQVEMQTVGETEQVSRNILRDLGDAARTNAPLRALLARHGYTLNEDRRVVEEEAP